MTNQFNIQLPERKPLTPIVLPPLPDRRSVREPVAAPTIRRAVRHSASLHIQERDALGETSTVAQAHHLTDARQALEARRFYWREVLGMEERPNPDDSDCFLFFNPRGACVARLWIEPVEARP